MLSPWAGIALWSLLPLAIVPFILIGRLLPNGAITATSGAAVITLSFFFTFFNGGYGLSAGPTTPTSAIAWLLGLLLLLAAWILALADAAQGRRWRWLLPLTLSAYLSFCALLALAISPDPCPFQPGRDIGPGLQCGQPDQILHLLTLAGCYIGALTALLYSLRDTIPGRSAE